MAKETLTSLAIGDMPQPQYIDDNYDNTKWIGIKAYSIDKEIKDFLLYKLYFLKCRFISAELFFSQSKDSLCYSFLVKLLEK